MNLKQLQKPYYLKASPVSHAKQAIVFGVFVFGFLYFFKPFGIGTLGDRFLNATLGFGAVTTLAMVFLNVLLPKVAPKLYREEDWTIGKEILQNGLNVWLIGWLNFLFCYYYLQAD